MADISKINAVLIANIAEIDDVLAANIAKVNGLVFSTAPGVQFLLDTYTGAAAAYSTRKLKTGVTVAARIRRSGDDIEADVEFDTNNQISLTSPISNASSGTYTDLADFVDHTGTPRDAFVDEWKDQSGNANHATQGTFGSQPKLYDATTGLITRNGKPAMQLDGTDDFMTATGGVWSRLAFAGVVYIDVPDDNLVLQYGDTTTRFHVGVGGIGSADKIGSRVYDGAFFGEDGADITDGQYLVYNDASISPDTNEMYLNGSAVTQAYGTRSSAPTAGTYTLGARGSGNYNFLGELQELVIWESDKSSNRSGIEGNLNAHFQIGNFGTPTSGLLYDYSGAAAAYSVRQLANTAALAMRIREDGTDTETDIGFDANGDLDTAAISSHCGANNGYVVTWYDQSGNQVDATQGTSGNQPQIYNGTAVITENGKPALDFASSTDHLLMDSVASDFSGEDSPLSYFMVCKPDTQSNQGALGMAGTTSYWAVQYLRGNGQISITKVDDAGTQDTFYKTGSYSLEQELYAAVSGGTSLELYIDNSLQVNATAMNVGTCTFTKAAIGAMYTSSNPTNYWSGNVQELILFDNDESSNRTGIETDINTYFSIY